jgi:phage gp29-like protein
MPRVLKNVYQAQAATTPTLSVNITRQSLNLQSIPREQAAVTMPAKLRSVMFASTPPKQDLFRSRYGRALNLDVIETALRSADWGNMRLLTDLSRETIDTDPHLASVLNKRFGAITALPWEVRPAEGNGIDIEKARFYADVVRAQLKQLPNFAARINQLAWGLYDGRAALENEWFMTASLPGITVPTHPKFGTVSWMVKDLGWIHPRRLHFGPDRELRVYDDLIVGNFGKYGIALRDEAFKFIFWTPQLFGDYPEREGLARRSLYWSFFKRFAARDRMILTELYGKPWRWLEVDNDSDADTTDLESADDILQNVGGNTSFRCPRGTKFKVEQPGKGAGEVHQDVIVESDKQISKLVLGQTGTTDANPAGLNNNQANVMQDEQFMLLMLDSVMMSEVIETYLTDAIIELNFGQMEVSHAPTFRLRADVPLDRAKEIARLDAALRARLEISVSEAYELSGFRVPKKDEPVIKLETPPLHPLAVQPPPERPVIVYPEGTELPAREVQPIAPTGEGGLQSPESIPSVPSAPAGALRTPENANPQPSNALKEPLTGESSVAAVRAEQLPAQVSTPTEVTLPFGGFKDFEDCVKKMKKDGHGKESAENICGALKHKYEGSMLGLENAHPSDVAVCNSIILQSYLQVPGIKCASTKEADVETEVLKAKQPIEKLVGTIEVLIDKGTSEGARESAKMVDVYAEAVEGLRDSAAILTALNNANEDMDIHGFSRAIERRMIHGVMSGAISSQYEFENETALPPAEFENQFGSPILLALPPVLDFVTRPLKDAIGWFKGLSIVTRSAFDRLDAAAKRRSFTISGLLNNMMLQKAKDELQTQVQEGGQLRDFRKFMTNRMESAGFVPANPSHVETIYRTNVLNAYNSGRHAQATQPSIMRLRPYWQIRTVNDGPPRQRKTHQSVHLWTLRANDSFWKNAYPPFGFNCRCRVVTLSEPEVRARKLTIHSGGEIHLLPDPGFTSGTASLL